MSDCEMICVADGMEEFSNLDLVYMLSDVAVPASTTETSTCGDAASKPRALKLPATNHRAPVAKPQGMHNKLEVLRCQNGHLES